jgi:hypothetical protein
VTDNHLKSSLHISAVERDLSREHPERKNAQAPDIRSPCAKAAFDHFRSDEHRRVELREQGRTVTPQLLAESEINQSDGMMAIKQYVPFGQIPVCDCQVAAKIFEDADQLCEITARLVFSDGSELAGVIRESAVLNQCQHDGKRGRRVDYLENVGDGEVMQARISESEKCVLSMILMATQWFEMACRAFQISVKSPVESEARKKSFASCPTS